MLWKTIKEDLLKHKNQLIYEKDTNITFEDLVSFAEMFSQKIADKSVKVVRNLQNVIPANLKIGSKILMVNIVEPHYHAKPTNHEYDALKDEFVKEGMFVDVYTNISHRQVKEIMDNYDLVLINCNFAPHNYHGATMRVGWNNIHLFWRGYILQHPKVIFTSFGDAYKLFDFPYLKNYINAFSFVEESQRAVAKLIMGKIKPQGKNPVDFPPFFNREV